MNQQKKEICRTEQRCNQSHAGELQRPADLPPDPRSVSSACDAGVVAAGWLVAQGRDEKQKCLLLNQRACVEEPGMVEEPPAVFQLCQTQKPASPGFLNVLSEVLHNLLWQHKTVVLLESFSYCLSCIFLADIKAHCLVQHGLYLWVLHIAENHYHVLLQPSPFPVKCTFFQFSSQTMLPWLMGTLLASLHYVQCSGSTHSPSPVNFSSFRRLQLSSYSPEQVCFVLQAPINADNDITTSSCGICWS